MAWRERTILIKLIKDCYLGPDGATIRLSHREGIKACEKGVARIHEWRPPSRKPKPDVQKAVNDGA